MKRINVYTVELVRESAKLYDLDHANITSPEDAYHIVERVLSLSTKPKEYFGMLSLSTKNKVIGVHVLHIGTLNASVVHPREVFQSALLNNAGSVILFHNHPSGDVKPSPEDISVTERMIHAGKIMGIQVLDHVIIGENKYLSLKERGYI